MNLLNNPSYQLHHPRIPDRHSQKNNESEMNNSQTTCGDLSLPSQMLSKPAVPLQLITNVPSPRKFQPLHQPNSHAINGHSKPHDSRRTSPNKGTPGPPPAHTHTHTPAHSSTHVLTAARTLYNHTLS